MPRAPFPAALALVAALAAALAAAGCTTDGEFPSLAPRAIEQEDPLAEPVRVPPEVAPDPALTARASELLDEARQGDAAFAAALPAAEASARAAGAAGSESWIAAQQALSRAESARAPTTRALAELDGLLIARAGAATAESDFAAIRAALEEAERLTRAQQARLDPLRRTISR